MDGAALAQTQQRYGEYFATLRQEQLLGLFQNTAARRLRQSDLYHIRRAWQWTVAERQVALLARSSFPLTMFHVYNGSFQGMATVSPYLTTLLLADLGHALANAGVLTEAITYGYGWLQSQAAKIRDAAIRQAFLHNVPEHRRLLTLAIPPALHRLGADIAR